MSDIQEQTDRPSIIRHVAAGQLCCDPEWEDAYKRFETPDEELAKFIKRLTRFGFHQLDRDARIVEIFCGRGVGLTALAKMGFRNLEGVDLSDTLLEEYRGQATLHLADCMDLPLENNTYDAVIVQGGLHHLPSLPDDLDRTLAGIRRILKPSGRFYAIEPWQTPFLTMVHAIVQNPLVRKFYAKGDALAAMIDRERQTYEQWLSQPRLVLQSLDDHFRCEKRETSWGKLAYVGLPR
ncbi:Demethylmenaquinone methyltransferase [Rubripirellula amarantea]|uniref:Demethylmenaquinone methyltransferase n=1 Tax=Rubripirellula amarantea TaxID=2527999 RepID=A0A5C5WXH1_9BACT|nr:class I SAM-dependent methyltransferase [Rubripirellula amarantea]TWT54703.1 Demethylmenaquinone methyltransferase [Rubripirellula amarantea]